MDWRDIALHVIAALVGTLILSWLGVAWTVILITNSVFWPAREWWQKVEPNGDEDSHLRLGEGMHAIFTRPQPLLEWTCPVLTGFIVYWVFP